MRRPAAGWPWPGALVDLAGGAVAGPGVVGAAAGAGVEGVVGAAASVFLEETGGVVVAAAAGVGGDGGFGREVAGPTHSPPSTTRSPPPTRSVASSGPIWAGGRRRR
ncbi:Os03g0189800 [Oryza sativa Japonica Group]|uniref:Os03g0189800 protein n=1 Tax=Oryza sativa subsp. japonica TaxID=39947 RepID=A0A0P0VU25_ORYSJ|nr:Os03g0189800 [Oryza sativa Japonica Group]